MFTTIDTTISGVSANSFISVAEADLYFEGRFVSGEGWSGYTEEQKTVRLLQAAIFMNRLSFIGIPTSRTQALAWPRRRGVVHHEYCRLKIRGFYVDTNVVPNVVRWAQAELALAILDDNGLIISADGVSSESLGKWAISYASIPNSLESISMEASLFLTPLLDDSVYLGRG